MHKMQADLKRGTILGDRWEISSLLGEGACAKVYSVKGTAKNCDYDLVAKVALLAIGKSKKDKQQERMCNTLNYEYMMYNGLFNNFPHRARTPEKFYGNDNTAGVRYLVMEKLDCDLVDLSKNASAVTPPKVAAIGLQILEGLGWIHNKNYMFVDVKPDNFMLKGDKLFFVDCELCTHNIYPSA